MRLLYEAASDTEKTMIRTMKMCFTAGLLAATSASLRAQAPATAPIPEQFASAHTVFLGNAGGPAGADEFAQDIYRGVYDALTKNGHYKVLASPTKADLFVESSFLVSVGDATGGTSFATPSVQLRFIDPPTHAVLWTLTVPIKGAFRKASAEKNIADATAKLGAELDDLIAGKFPQDPKDK